MTGSGAKAGVQGDSVRVLELRHWLFINQTEALVAHRRQHGALRREEVGGTAEDTILKTNLEAAKEIARQVRLRDLGGIIVLDLIDVEAKKNRQKVLRDSDRGAEDQCGSGRMEPGAARESGHRAGIPRRARVVSRS